MRGVTVEEVSEAEEHHLAGCAGDEMFIEMRGGLLQRIGDGGAEMSPWRMWSVLSEGVRSTSPVEQVYCLYTT